jgi:glutamate-1-semialdehyde 2,1-aminomutase
MIFPSMSQESVAPTRLKESLEWFDRATKVIPGGVYGHTSPAAALPLSFPYYIHRAEGCYLWDVDGNRYLDFLCAYGPIILGHQHPEVETAAAAERDRGGLYSHPSTVMVELAELMVQRIDFAQWCVFGKNGSDMTTWAMQVARQHSGRKKVLVVQGAYHGVDAWTNPSPGGVIEEDRLHIHSFAWNDARAVEALMRRFRGQVACVILTPYHHPTFGAPVMPDPRFVDTIHKCCRKHDVVLILDDIRSGFRLHPNGSHGLFGWEPHIACYCKAMGNGYPISAAVGVEALKSAASKVFLTGSYWNDAISMAAAKQCLTVIARDRIPDRLRERGSELLNGLEDAAASHRIKVKGMEPAAAPYLVFENDADLRGIQRFSTLCAERGVLFHPHHNWFISAAHSAGAIAEAVEAARAAFKVMAKEGWSR